MQSEHSTMSLQELACTARQYKCARNIFPVTQVISPTCLYSKIYRGYLLFEVDIKYISSSVLKIPMFSTHKMKYILVFTKKKKFLFNLYILGDLRLID